MEKYKVAYDELKKDKEKQDARVIELEKKVTSLEKDLVSRLLTKLY